MQILICYAAKSILGRIKNQHTIPLAVFRKPDMPNNGKTNGVLLNINSIIYITSMQQFYKFENKEDITTSDVKFSFNKLNEIYTKTEENFYRILCII
jgi:hypothetical protein